MIMEWSLPAQASALTLFTPTPKASRLEADFEPSSGRRCQTLKRLRGEVRTPAFKSCDNGLSHMYSLSQLLLGETRRNTGLNDRAGSFRKPFCILGSSSISGEDPLPCSLPYLLGRALYDLLRSQQAAYDFPARLVTRYRCTAVG
jgi:hypothetical protein